MARPLKEIDKGEFEKLCALQCTEAEICQWFGVAEKTLNSWCKRTYRESFSQIFRQKRGKGKIALRRAQMQAALGGNTSLLIFLGKQYLGQSERVSASPDIDDAQTEDALSKSLREFAEGLESDKP